MLCTVQINYAMSIKEERQTDRQNKGGQVATGEGWTQKEKSGVT